MSFVMGNSICFFELCTFSLFVLFFGGLPCESLQVSNLSYLDNLVIGEKRHVKLTLINDTDVNDNISLTLADYSCNSDGQHFYEEHPSGNDGAVKRSNISWVHVNPQRISLKPRETRDVYYTIEVPNNEELKGSYWSVLLIEPEGNFNMVGHPNEGYAIQVKIRYAHHIVVNIQGGASKVKILKKEVKEIDGRRFLCLHVINEGNRIFIPSVTLKLYSRGGNLEKTLQSSQERLYPGNSHCILLEMKDIEESDLRERYIGFIVFDGQDNILFGDQFSYP